MCWPCVQLRDLLRDCRDTPLGSHLAPPSPGRENNPPCFPAFARLRDRPAASILSVRLAPLGDFPRPRPGPQPARAPPLMTLSPSRGPGNSHARSQPTRL